MVKYSDSQKWGYKIDNKVVIQPQYDTAFDFDKDGSIAMVGNKNLNLTLINPLTGEESFSTDYYFINKKNEKIKLLSEPLTDSIFTFPNQEELHLNYLNDLSVFQILFDNKIYLLKKNGKQLSAGYENMYQSEKDNFFITENSVKQMNDIRSAKGLIDSNGNTIVKCENRYISINSEDSVIYCCSALFNSTPDDEVFDYNGNLIYSNKNHIVYSSKFIHVYKLYTPKELYIIENTFKKAELTIEGEDFHYLKGHKALIIKKNEWLLVDLQTMKKQKVSKEDYNQNLNVILK